MSFKEVALLCWQKNSLCQHVLCLHKGPAAIAILVYYTGIAVPAKHLYLRQDLGNGRARGEVLFSNIISPPSFKSNKNFSCRFITVKDVGDTCTII